MTFNDIIQNNCASHCPISWWPKFAYHYTDISNTVSILASENLYSRIKATELHLMKNDNASRQVIDMTESSATTFVRFYFRPLTPTQYYNEGFKHKRIRYDGDNNANVPVPVFLLFNLEKLLSHPETRFSQQSQAGRGAAVYQGIEQFSRLDFEKIYSKGAASQEVIKYRHAELSFPNVYPVPDNLECIFCRTEVEKTSLLNLLNRRDQRLFFKYKDIIRVPRTDTFEKNGFFISEIAYHENSLSISFNNTYQKRLYFNRMKEVLSVSELEKMPCELRLSWLNAKKTPLFERSAEMNIGYFDESFLVKKIPKIDNARLLSIEFYVEGALLCCIERSLDNSELI